MEKISANLRENLAYTDALFENCMDYLCRNFRIGETGAALLSFDGLIDKRTVSESILTPVLNAGVTHKGGKGLYEALRDHALSSAELVETDSFGTLLDLLLSGFAALLIDGSEKAMLFGVQGFETRSVSEPAMEAAQRGSREGFVEAWQINASLIRRRLRTSDLKIERMVLGTASRTNLALCYLASAAPRALVDRIKSRLSKIRIQTVLASGYLAPFLEYGGLFGCVGYTERPDTVCGKIAEGRVAILVDGTPDVLIVPFLFTEYFQNFDDYVVRPFFAAFSRILKWIAFFAAILLPASYIALMTDHPQLLSGEMLERIASENAATPLSFFSETIFTMILYEIMREAGQRVVKSLGGAVGIVGGLVVGEAAVNAKIIGSMTLMVVAASALCSYTVPKLYESIGAVRMMLILSAGIFGVWGIFLFLSYLLINTCAQSAFGVPFTAPLTPFSRDSMRDTFLRQSWRKLSRRVMNLRDLPGAREVGKK